MEIIKIFEFPCLQKLQTLDFVLQFLTAGKKGKNLNLFLVRNVSVVPCILATGLGKKTVTRPVLGTIAWCVEEGRGTVCTGLGISIVCRVGISI